MHISDIHTLVSELIKGILSVAAASPASGLATIYSGVDSNIYSKGADSARKCECSMVASEVPQIRFECPSWATTTTLFEVQLYNVWLYWKAGSESLDLVRYSLSGSIMMRNSLRLAGDSRIHIGLPGSPHK